ncbi:Beta-peptidyl aminopeptidase BapA [Cyphellophora attinorum]|uniref:Beta-peptidyl aminopeptidase BapA n=1 Tax=Cyphellophora attinorum TaxID=1664694 RepID=A0A0N1HNI2_9EURO|nr:Beta-peptidyl aminopeptidase BapA [Phialophora attinorum]KPI36632.1 Beta-peptidyl aminopeptidase BapA [Phialophora attinorum]
MDIPPTLKDEAGQPRQRVRELLPDLHLGFHPPGPLNAITDVPGVLVSALEIFEDDDGRIVAEVTGRRDGLGRRRQIGKTSDVNTGVTVILPRPNPAWFTTACYSSIFSFNGSGELTGSHWIKETGLLNSPIVLTNSFSVGAAYSGIYEFAIRGSLRSQGRGLKGDMLQGGAKDGMALGDYFLLPVVGETYDGFLNDIGRMVVKPEHVLNAIELAAAGGNSPTGGADAPIPDRTPNNSQLPPSRPVHEGSTGGGTGMLTMGFKGGTGTSSRIVPGILHGEPTQWTVGCLVQSNFGKLEDLHFGSVPVGREWKRDFAGTEWRDGCIFAGTGSGGTASDVSASKMAGDGGKNAAQEGFTATNPTTPPDGSIIVILSTNAPLNPTQLQRLAKRATVGLSRVGGFGANSSGDIFLAFSTAPGPQREPEAMPGYSTWEARRAARVEEQVGVDGGFVQDTTINGLFEAAAEAVMEAVLNAMCMAEGVVGVEGNRASGIPLGWVKKVVEERYGGGR